MMSTDTYLFLRTGKLQRTKFLTVVVEIDRYNHEPLHAVRVNALKDNAKQNHKANYKSRAHTRNPNRKMSAFGMA